MNFRFDFTEAGSGCLAREYSGPVASFRADAASAVPGVLAQAQAALEAGLHVAGFLSFEAAAALDPVLKAKPASLQDLPLAMFAAFEGPVPRRSLPVGEFGIAGWEPGSAASEHAAAVARIKRHIAAGDTYQVNLTMRLYSQLHGSVTGLYRALLTRQPAAWSAYVDLDSHQLLSCSPELFFLRKADRIITRPMKGTVRRSADVTEDEVLIASLLASVKDRAENVMITDLLRNDLGRLARTGSVQVEKLLQLESQPTFHALTSTVTAELARDTGLARVFAALFPCGSVTGAPKASTMGIIRELEPSPRGIYCGTIGFADPDGTWAFNVAIRTLQHQAADGQLIYGAGGGITWDSEAGAEYREALLKASFLPGAPPEWQTGSPEVVP